MRILRYDLIRQSATTLSSGTTMVSTAGTAQLAKDDRTVARTSTLPATWVINATFASNQTLDMVVLGQHNLSDAATVRVQLYSDTAMTTQLTDTGHLDAFNGSALATPFDVLSATYRNLKNTVIYPTQQTTVRGLKITITDAANADGFLECRRLMAGQFFQPRRGPGFGAQLVQASASRTARSDSGSRTPDARGNWRELAITLGNVEAEDLDDWAAILQYHDKVLTTAVDIYPGDTTAKGILNRMVAGFDDLGGFEATAPGLHRLPIRMGEL